MKILIQRVNHASVQVDYAEVASITAGLLLLVGFSKDDNEDSFQPLIDKILNLRIFPKSDGTSGFDISIKDIKGSILIVSQFTLYADCSRGRRPGFSDAKNPEEAKVLYDKFLALFKSCYTEGPIAAGVFGGYMKVESENDGPVTIMLEG